MTANEIINLKYKTIIFPVFGNPIFRDTYLYSDIYPQYKNYPIYERETKILKRLTDNYYTVEKLREIYEKDDNEDEDIITRKVKQNFEASSNRRINKIMRSINSREMMNFERQSILEDYLIKLKALLENKIERELILEDNVYLIELNTSLSKFEIAKIIRQKDKQIFLETSSNKSAKKTIITLWEKELEKEGIY